MLAAIRQTPYLIFHVTGRAVLAGYAQDQAVIDAQIDGLVAAGAAGCSLSPWVEHPDPAMGIGFDYDFLPILKRMKSAGMRWVQIAPQFYGSTNPRWSTNAWPSANLADTPDWYRKNWNFVSQLPAVIAAAGLAGIVDVSPEFNDHYSDPQSPGLKPYTKRIWIDASGSAVAPFFGAPCHSYSLSFIPKSDLSEVADAFQGNAPALYLPHCYSNGGQTLLTNLTTVRNGLQAAGLPDRPWHLGETSSLRPGDEMYAQQLAAFVASTGVLLHGVSPWPILPETPRVDAAGLPIEFDPACTPQFVSSPWPAVGC